MKLFQYWDTGDPPDDVAGWIESFRHLNPEMTHRLYDRDSASWFIGKHLGQRHRRAFDACAVPAMQADYFRACALWAKGGAWADADCAPQRPLGELFKGVSHALITAWEDYFPLDLMMFRQADDPLLGAWLKRITKNVEDRVPGNVSMVTGPDAFQLVVEAAEPGSPAHTSLSRVTPLDWSRAGPWRGLPQGRYKDGPRHWLNWKGSIYRD